MDKADIKLLTPGTPAKFWDTKEGFKNGFTRYHATHLGEVVTIKSVLAPDEIRIWEAPNEIIYIEDFECIVDEQGNVSIDEEAFYALFDSE